MNPIDDSKHFATVPKHEYEELLSVYNDKKDINISINLLTYRNTGYGNSYLDRLVTVSSSFDHTTGTTDRAVKELYSTLDKMIEATIKETEERKNEEIKMFVNELTSIKSKWWFKLFAPKYMQL